MVRIFWKGHKTSDFQCTAGWGQPEAIGSFWLRLNGQIVPVVALKIGQKEATGSGLQIRMLQ